MSLLLSLIGFVVGNNLSPECYDDNIATWDNVHPLELPSGISPPPPPSPGQTFGEKCDTNMPGVTQGQAIAYFYRYRDESLNVGTETNRIYAFVVNSNNNVLCASDGKMYGLSYLHYQMSCYWDTSGTGHYLIVRNNTDLFFNKEATGTYTVGGGTPQPYNIDGTTSNFAYTESSPICQSGMVYCTFYFNQAPPPPMPPPSHGRSPHLARLAARRAAEGDPARRAA